MSNRVTAGIIVAAMIGVTGPAVAGDQLLAHLATIPHGKIIYATDTGLAIQGESGFQFVSAAALRRTIPTDARIVDVISPNPSETVGGKAPRRMNRVRRTAYATDGGLMELTFQGFRPFRY